MRASTLLLYCTYISSIPSPKHHSKIGGSMSNQEDVKLQPDEVVVNALKAQLEAAERGDIRTFALVATRPDGTCFTQIVSSASKIEMIGLTAMLHRQSLSLIEVTGG